MLELKDQDRRAEVRVPLRCGCKVLDRSRGRYFAALTRDVSEHGALLDVAGLSRGMREGDAVEVAIDWRGRRLVASASLRSGRVVRVDDGVGGRQVVAVRFERAEPARMAA
ncbi:MAG: PilZ domain-containing protein [Phycisphaerales bacterium]|nr:MAG: PilZ domain-containing protein [Phycisphaerales bacterium]